MVNFKLYPYKNRWLVAAQIISVVASMLSWVWFATFCTSIVTMLLYQSLWFWRQKQCYLILYAMLAILAGAISTYTGIYVHQNWTTSSLCLPFFRVDNKYDNEAICYKTAFIYISFACAVLWFVVSIITIVFVVTGKHSKLEAKWKDETTDNDGSKDSEEDGNDNRNDNIWERSDVEDRNEKNSNNNIHSTRTSASDVWFPAFEQALPLATSSSPDTTLAESGQVLPLATTSNHNNDHDIQVVETGQALPLATSSSHSATPDPSITESGQVLPLVTISGPDDVPDATLTESGQALMLTTTSNHDNAPVSARSIGRETASMSSYV